MTRVVALLLVVGLVVGTRMLPPGPTAHALGAGMALGMLLLGGYLAGRLFAELKLPRITGYIAFGLVAGPQVSNLLEVQLMDALGPVDGLAVALIALNAGAELRFGWLRHHLVRIAVICLLTAALVGGAVTGLLLLTRESLPLLAGLGPGQQVAASVVLGITMASTSPLVILAVTSESRARGPVTDTLLGVAILMDLLVVIASGVALAVARTRLGVGGAEGHVAVTLAFHILGSIVAGIVLGAGLVLYVRLVGRELALVVAGLALVIAEVGVRVDLEPLLVAISAGIVLINFGGSRSSHFVHAIERVSLPVYALFFGVIGANLNLSLLVSLGLVGGLLVLVRAAMLYASTSLGARLTRAEETVRRHAWLGLVSQAGITLGIAVTVARTFPDWGPAVEDLVVGITAVNTVVGPVLQRLALLRAGEVGRAAPAVA